MASVRIRPILIVDDDPDALALTQHALAKAGVTARFDVVQDSRRAIAYLKNRLARGEQTLPLLTFLDLEMPGTDGFEVLQWIRHQPRLRRMLRVVLSSSIRRRDDAATSSARQKNPSGTYRSGAGIHTVFQLAHAVLSVDEIESLVLPGMSPSPAVAR